MRPLLSRNVARSTLAARGRDRRRRQETLWGYALVAPLVFGLVVFYLLPAVLALAGSLTAARGFAPATWAGLRHYRALFGDAELYRALGNTARLAALSVPLSLGGGLALAALLHERPRGAAVYRTLFLLPAVTMPAATAVIWRWLLNGDYGLINGGLRAAGLAAPRWLTDPAVAPVALAGVSAWSSMGPAAIILLAGMRQIPTVYLEAAALDGAGPLARLRHVTLPLLTPTLLFVTVVSLVTALQTVDLVLLMVDPTSPALAATETVLALYFRHAFVRGDHGYAAAIAALLLLVTLLLTLLQLRLRRRWVHDELD